MRCSKWVLFGSQCVLPHGAGGAWLVPTAATGRITYMCAYMQWWRCCLTSAVNDWCALYASGSVGALLADSALFDASRPHGTYISCGLDRGLTRTQCTKLFQIVCTVWSQFYLYWIANEPLLEHYFHNFFLERYYCSLFFRYLNSP